jgi:hypothetical protein
MDRKIYEHNGWKVIATKNGKFGLSYDSHILTEDTLGALIEINEDVFNAACNPDIELKDLFEKYNLYENKVLYKLKKVILTKTKENTPIKFYGGDFIVTQEGEKYFLKYLLSCQGGGSRKFEISKEIYEDARKGDKSTSDLFKKYNLYHLDVPENDVK